MLRGLKQPTLIAAANTVSFLKAVKGAPNRLCCNNAPAFCAFNFAFCVCGQLQHVGYKIWQPAAVALGWRRDRLSPTAALHSNCLTTTGKLFKLFVLFAGWMLCLFRCNPATGSPQIIIFLV